MLPFAVRGFYYSCPQDHAEWFEDVLSQMRAVTVLRVNLGKCLNKPTKTNSLLCTKFMSRITLHGKAVPERLLKELGEMYSGVQFEIEP